MAEPVPEELSHTESWPELISLRVRQLKLLRRSSTPRYCMNSNSCSWLTKRELRTCKSNGTSRSELMTTLFLAYRIRSFLPLVLNQTDNRMAFCTVHCELPNPQ